MIESDRYGGVVWAGEPLGSADPVLIVADPLLDLTRS